MNYPKFWGWIENWKKRARDICKGTLYIEFERDWSAGLGATLGDGQKIKNYFSSSRDFSRKNRERHIVGLRMYYKPTKVNQTRWRHFEKIEILNFSLCELPLILRLDLNRKKGGWIWMKEDPLYRIWTRLVSWFRYHVREFSKKSR